MEKIINNDIEIGSLEYTNGCWEAKPNNNETCRFYTKEEAELYVKQVFEIESNMSNIKKALKEHHSIIDVKKVQINDGEEDGAILVLSGVLKGRAVFIELWAKDYCVDIYPKNSEKWGETIFFGTLQSNKTSE